MPGLGSTKSVLGKLSRSSGKRYIEFVFDSGSATASTVVHDLGITTQTLITSGDNGAAYGIGYRVSGHIVDTAILQTVTALSAGDVVSLAVDLDAGKAWFARNGTWTQGDPAAGTSPVLAALPAGSYRAFMTVDDGETMKGTLRSRTAQFSYPPPSGFVSWSTAGGATAGIAAGDTITTPSATAYVLRVALDAGAWAAGTAAGRLIVADLAGAVADNEAIQVSLTTRALVDGAVAASSAGDPDYATDIVLTRNYYRNLITKPTGYGPILGVALFKDVAYCLRDDDAGGLTATLWRSSSSGWVAARTGLRGGGPLRTVNASFNGTGGDLGIYGVDGKNRPWKYDGTTFTFAPAIYSSEGTSATTITPGAGAKVFTITEGTRSWTPGQELRIYSAANAANYMVGTVTTWSAPTLTMNVTSFGGASSSDWHVCTTAATDRAFIVAAHKNHLFLSYPLGQLQHSDLGAPFTFSATSGAIGLGDEMVDLTTLRSDVLAIFQSGRVSVLYGSGKSSWELKQHSLSSNTRAGSAREVGGNGVYINDAGIISLEGSDAFGDFDAANLAGSALRTLRGVLQGYTATSLVKSDNQYRVYGTSKQVLVMSWAGGALTSGTSFTRLRYEHQPVCTATGNSGGEEVVLFGTDDGWVMRERVGTTFDGADISAFIRTSYWHSGNPAQKKRYRKLTLDCDALEEVTLRFKLDFDFSGVEYMPSIEFSAEPSGGFYDVDNWDEFFWSNPEAAQLETSIEGVGRFMSMLLWAEGDFSGFNVYGMALQYSPLEIKR
jgi:hypothetical protein